jgi:hypothetical protein
MPILGNPLGKTFLHKDTELQNYLSLYSSPWFQEYTFQPTLYALVQHTSLHTHSIALYWETLSLWPVQLKYIQAVILGTEYA